MNILVIYTTFQKKDRNVFTDSIDCYRRYVKGHRFYYLNVQRPEDLSEQVQAAPFDGVIFHVSFLSWRNAEKSWEALYEKMLPALTGLKGRKAMVPHDEYMNTNALRRFAKDCGISHIFTGARADEYALYYPPALCGGAECHTVFTGYINEAKLPWLRRLEKKRAARDIDVGYRVRRLPYWLGRHGQLKYELGSRFSEALQEMPGLVHDFAYTGEDGQNAFFGDDWFRFLLRCRTMPGCLGGSSVLDADGRIKARTDAYMAGHPNAAFSEAEAACFNGQDGKAHTFLLGPRHFECAMAKVCQVLVEGDYYGVFTPGLHYIELKADFSNLAEVLEKVRDRAYCDRIAQRCYNDVVAPPGPGNPYTYAWFANFVTDVLLKGAPAQPAPKQAARACRRAVAKAGRQLKVYKTKQMLYTKLYRFADAHPAWVRFAKRLLGRL